MRYRRLVGRSVTLISTGGVLPRGDLLHGARLPMMVAPAYWRPAVDVCETAEALTINVELAGVDLVDLDLLLLENALVVAGERRLQACAPGGVYHRAEIHQGPFRIEIHLPRATVVGVAAEGESGGVDARFERGMLQLTLRKTGGDRGQAATQLGAGGERA